MEKTYYQEFGLREAASLEEIKRAYRRLVLIYHPDKNRGAIKFENVFKRVNHIYTVLSDPRRRKEYDEELERKRESYTTTNPSNQTQPSIISVVFGRFVIWLIMVSLSIILYMPSNRPSPRNSTDDSNEWKYTIPQEVDHGPSKGELLLGNLNQNKEQKRQSRHR